MDKFAFMIHPLDIQDVERKFPYAKYLPEPVIERFLRLAPSFKASTISNVSSSYNEVEGFFIACPLTTRQMVSLPADKVIKKIIQGGKVAEKLGAKILGLGAFTKIVGDRGVTVAKNLNIPVTTGNSYTVAAAIEGTKQAAKAMDIDLRKAQVVIIGATGAIGRVCAEVLASEVRNITLVGRNKRELEKVANRLLFNTGTAAGITTDLKQAVRKAEVIITASNSLEALIEPEDLKPGSVVCDVARPRDVSAKVAEIRDDVLIVEGGLVKVPGDVNFNLNFGFPPGTAYACMAETMMLALEGRFESFTLGKDLTVEQVTTIKNIGDKHGFEVIGLRSFEREVSTEEVNKIKKRAKERLLKGSLTVEGIQNKKIL